MAVRSMSVEPIEADGIFRVGGVLSRAWRLFTSDILFFLGVPVLMALPVALAIAAATLPVPGRAVDHGPGMIEVFLDAILALGLGMVGHAVLLLGAFQRLRGRPPDMARLCGRRWRGSSPCSGSPSWQAWPSAPACS
jgi:hypothetical protein